MHKRLDELKAEVVKWSQGSPSVGAVSGAKGGRKCCRCGGDHLIKDCPEPPKPSEAQKEWVGKILDIDAAIVAADLLKKSSRASTWTVGSAGCSTAIPVN